MSYPVYMHDDENGSVSGFFPGVPGCYFAGESYREALIDASDALVCHLATLKESGAAIPQPESVETYQDHVDCVGGVWGFVAASPD